MLSWQPGDVCSQWSLPRSLGVYTRCICLFLRHSLILFAKLTIACKGLEMAVQLSFSILEAESDFATVVYGSLCSARLDGILLTYWTESMSYALLCQLLFVMTFVRPSQPLILWSIGLVHATHSRGILVLVISLQIWQVSFSLILSRSLKLWDYFIYFVVSLYFSIF